MKQITIPLIVSAALGAAAGCVHQPTPIERAAPVARAQCSDPQEARDEARVLRETTVIKVEPIVFHAGAGTRTEGGFTTAGARLFVRAPDGVSPEELAGILQCHSAKVLLGQVDPAALPNDPYSLPDSWISIDVTAVPGALVVTLTSDTVRENLAVLRRATAFADAHRQTAAQ